MTIEIRSLKTTELGNATHVVIERESGVAVVIDPVRDVDQHFEVTTSESVTSPGRSRPTCTTTSSPAPVSSSRPAGRVVGVLDGGIDIWQTSGRTLTGYETISAAVLAERLDAERFLTVIDVREPFEWYADHLPGSVNLPAHDIETASLKLPRGVALAVHCGHDYRATLGASLSERAGHPDLVVLEDGWEGWAALDLDDWS
ncbi:MAG: hypothetical protein MP439_07535 [Ferrimicrobium sp.]|jgi:rhodanese-related sulfurtransferase|nr:hypothetical protein [Ferrimicrobium sp.]